jgi:hypothetical protein
VPTVASVPADPPIALCIVKAVQYQTIGQSRFCILLFTSQSVALRRNFSYTCRRIYASSGSEGIRITFLIKYSASNFNLGGYRIRLLTNNVSFTTPHRPRIHDLSADSDSPGFKIALPSSFKDDSCGGQQRQQHHPRVSNGLPEMISGLPVGISPFLPCFAALGLQWGLSSAVPSTPRA